MDKEKIISIIGDFGMLKKKIENHHQAMISDVDLFIKYFTMELDKLEAGEV